MSIKAEERRYGRDRPLRHGALLRTTRERAGMSPKEISRLTGMSLAQLSDIERGIGALSLRRAQQLSCVLGEEPFLEIVQAVLQDRLDEAGFHLDVSVKQRTELPTFQHISVKSK